MCIDFNCTPGSAMVEYISKGCLDIVVIKIYVKGVKMKDLNMTELSGQKESYRKHKFIPESIVNKLSKDGVMRHSLQLNSAYDHSKRDFISSFMIDFAGKGKYWFV